MRTSAGLTPSQTVGPYFSIGLSSTFGPYLVPPGTTSGAIHIHGRVLDGAGEPVPDALIETSQAEGCGRCATDHEGHFAVVVVKPSAASPIEAPHLAVSVFARGLLNRLVTRLYFPDEGSANEADSVLNSLSEETAARLIAVTDDHGLRFDIYLQGEHETAFFAL